MPEQQYLFMLSLDARRIKDG